MYNSSLIVNHNIILSPGHYMFIESSSPRRPGDNAILQSATLTGSNQAQCIAFFYNMYGVDIGTLRVWAQPLNGVAIKLWELTGNQGVQWLPGAVSFTQTSQFQVNHTTMQTVVIAQK